MVPCTGRVDEVMILKSFENAADGVMVVGCLEGDCHYLKGNLRARERVKRATEILEKVGIGSERARMFNLSAGQGSVFAKYAVEFVDHIRELGPSPINLRRAGKPVETATPKNEE